ncbi:hypothetical protein T492DRAFT_1046936, partial [Pavlovales sp. CCMP2436]
SRALERAGPDRCPAWEHDKQQPADHLPKRPCPGTLPEIHRHARWRPSQRSRLRHAAGNGRCSAQTSTTFRTVRRQLESLS